MFKTVGSYSVPKDTLVICNIWRLLRDPLYWDNPEVFQPERFLEPDEDGGGVKGVKIPEQFLPFGVGRRVCLGESLARQELFIMIVRMIQKIEISFPDDLEKPGMEEDIMGVTRNTKPFHVNMKIMSNTSI